MADPESKGAEKQTALESTATKQPLYIRLYFQDHMIELVRLFGYESLPISEAQEQLKSLTEKYGEEVLRAATDEIIEIDTSNDPYVARLTEYARKLSVEILGRPPKPQKGKNVPNEETAPDATDTPASILETPSDLAE